MCDPFQPPAMSGEIFQPLETFEEQVESGRGPLTCRLCTQQYEDPRILNCHHVFCGNCLRGRAVDGFMTCPLCGTRSFLTNGSNLPQADPVINFLLKSSEQERALCANCDTMQSSMFFCNTCNQALCALCKEETHMAKMFASHQLVSLKKRTSEQHRKCAKHNDEYIMYSTEKQELLCIKCFRDFEKDDRAFCLDLESAYKQSCRQLEERILTIRDLQSSVHDAIILFQALMQEVRSNGEKERVSIQELCAEMQERMVEKKEELLKDVDSQQLQKEQAFKDQLPSLAALLPALQTNLAISTMFVSGANMYEFLDLSSSLNERLASIANQPHQLRPQESGEISTDYEAKFARCLQPVLRIHLDNCDDCGSSSPIIHVSMPTTSTAASPQQQPPAARTREHPAPQPLSSAYISSALARHLSLTNTLQDPLAGKGLRRGSKMAASIRHRLQEGNGPFVEHCKAFEANFRLLQHRIQKMKEQVQEIHRDITRRKCLAKKEKVTDVLDECSQVEIQIGTHTATLEHMKVIFQKIWQEMLNRVSSEQEIYQTQLKDMNYLKQENSHLATIARQIAPYITSIDAVTKHIDPRSRSASPHESEDEGSEGNPLHITKLVLTSNTKNSITDSAERDPDTSPIQSLVSPDINPSQSLMSPDGTTNTSHDTPSTVSHDASGSHDVLFQGDGVEAKKAFHRTLSEQEEFERLRAKKIVMDAIMSEQCKEALKESGVSKFPEPDLPCGSTQRPQATCSNGVEDNQKCIDADRGLTVTKLDLDHPCGSTQRPQSGKCLEEPKNYADADRHVKVTNGLDTEHSCGNGQGPKAEKDVEETQKSGKADRLLKVVDVNGSSSDSSHDLGIVKQRVKRERLGDEGIVQTTVTEADAEEGGVSVSSRVKRFSLSDDQVEMAQKQQTGACPGSPRPPPRAQNDAKRVVVKPNDAEVKQRSVMSVTVTTSEDTSSTHTSNPTSIEHSKGKGPVTDETENIVLRVRNRRKLREQATLANNS